MKKTFLKLVIAMFATVSFQANALFLEGDALRIEWIFPDTGTIFDSWDVVVGAGVEVANASGFGAIDIDATNGLPSILFDFTSTTGFVSGSFNGFRITDYTGTVADFTDVSINSITNMLGFDASRISFTADTIDINFASLNFTADTFAGFDIASVPEPSIIWLLGSGVLLMGFARRKA